VFTHTETLPRFGGRGLAGRLVRHALDEARAGGHPVVPECWFVAAYIRDHPDDVELLPAELRRRFAPH
jgi:predicted GNAT family acetyltransferase